MLTLFSLFNQCRVRERMMFDDAKKIVESWKKQPLKTIVIIVVLILLLALSAYVLSFCGKKGEQHASPSQVTHETVSPDGSTETKPVQPKKQDKSTTEPPKANTQGDHIDQKTGGNQSPAIVSDGNIKIEYGGQK